MPKVVVITGGNSGIGLAIAHEVAKRGAVVCLPCRDQAKGMRARDEILRATPGAQVELYELDLASFAKIRAFAEAFKARHDKLDALINNAGVYCETQQFTADGYEQMFGANYLGPVLLTHLLLPLLQKAATEDGEARIVHMASIGHNVGRIDPATFRGRKPYFALPAYGQSKLGNLMFSNVLSRRLPKGISSQAMHPGGVASPLYRELPGWQYAVLKPFLIGPERPGKLAADLALAPEHRGETGGYYSIQHPKLVSSTAKNVAAQNDLYEQSCKLLGIAPLPA